MQKGKIFLEKNFIAGLLVFCFGVGMAVSARMKYGIYPLTVFVLMILIGGFVMVMTMRNRPGKLLERVSWKEIVYIALLFLSPLLAKHLGFYFSGYLVIAGVSWLIEPEKNGKTLAKTLIYSLVVTIAAYFVFTGMLKISTPVGILR